jgi:hypothetical protein
LAALSFGGAADERSLPSLERGLVVKGQGYFPVALRLQDGRIASKIIPMRLTVSQPSFACKDTKQKSPIDLGLPSLPPRS